MFEQLKSYVCALSRENPSRVPIEILIGNLHTLQNGSANDLMGKPVSQRSLLSSKVIGRLKNITSFSPFSRQFIWIVQCNYYLEMLDFNKYFR